MQETRVQYLGWKDPLEKEMATHSSILAWRIPWTEEPGGLQSMGLQELDTTEQLNCYYYWIIEKAREFRETSASLTTLKPLCGSQQTGKFSKPSFSNM